MTRPPIFLEPSFGLQLPSVVVTCGCGVQDGQAGARTLDLASTLETRPGSGGGAARAAAADAGGACRSVLTIAFQFTFETHLRDHVAAMARQYVRSVVASVQRVAMAIAPSQLGPRLGLKPPAAGSPEALTLAQWICRSYRYDLSYSLSLSSPPNPFLFFRPYL